MSFKEILEKYTKGEANEKEKKIVEEELEKYEAIEEYYAENILFPLGQGGHQGLDEEKISSREKGKKSNEDTFNINKMINKRLRKVVITSVAIVILLYVSIFFVLSSLVNLFYYNPSKISMSEYHPDVGFDLRAVTELNAPGYTMPGIKHVETEGFGSYTINYHALDLFTTEVDTHNVRIRRGKHYGAVEGLVNFRFNSAFKAVANHSLYKKGFFEGQLERMTTHLNAFNEVAYVSAYLAFYEDITLEEFAYMKSNIKELDFQWVGVRTHDKEQRPEERPNHLTGFNPKADGGSASDYRPDPEKYPSFNILDHILEGRDGTPKGWAKTYEEHYQTLLKYVVDRGDAVKALDPYPGKGQYYKEALDYVEKNGVSVFGILVFGEAQDLLDFVEQNEFLSIEIDRVLPSKPYLF